MGGREMADDDRTIGRLEAQAEARKQGERDLWEAKQKQDQEISDLRARLTVIETEKAFAGWVAKALWTAIGGSVMWAAQHFGIGVPTPK